MFLVRSITATSAKDGDQPQKLRQRGGSCGNIGQRGSGKGLSGAFLLFVSQKISLRDGFHRSATGIEFHRQGDELEYKGKTKQAMPRYTNK